MGAVTRSPIWHPFTQHGLNEPIPLVTHAEGASLYTQDGKRVIDAVSSWWVTTHGHAHPRIAAAIADQAARLDQLIFAGWTHQPAQTLAHGLVAMVDEALGAGALPYVFFSDSGSTSVEVALKMALGYWVHRGEKRDRVLVMQHSYHGDTIGAMSVGERGVYNVAYEPLLFDVGIIPFPHPGAEQATYDALEAECRAGAATFIVEPLILGAGGMLIYPPHVLAEMARICAAHGTLLIADEVMTGWGRTGTFLACEQAGIAPDILCMAKGLTGGAIRWRSLWPAAPSMMPITPPTGRKPSTIPPATPPTPSPAPPPAPIWRSGARNPCASVSRICARGRRKAQRCWRRCRASPMCVSAGPFWRWIMWWRAGAIFPACNRVCWPSSARRAC
jgi:adenosylmethionine-8-amino-7-oxononanoate aminotransferase